MNKMIARNMILKLDNLNNIHSQNTVKKDFNILAYPNLKISNHKNCFSRFFSQKLNSYRKTLILLLCVR